MNKKYNTTTNLQFNAEAYCVDIIHSTHTIRTYHLIKCSVFKTFHPP